MLASKNRFMPVGTSVESTHVKPAGRRRKGTPTILAAAITAALAGTLPAAADAAGLGRLTVQSALGQPLRAEVEITSVGSDELGSLSARLASPEAFRQAGLEFNPALTGLRFAIDRRSDRSAVVRISSGQPINEPFVDLMVELNWASGKFVREYTFLLDPPELRIGRESVAGGPATQQIVTPSVAAARSPSAQATPTVAPAATAAPAAPAAPAAGAPASAAPAASGRAAASPVPAAARSAPAASTPAAAPGEVTTRTGDTLAGIAARVKPADVSLEQAIIAIYDANRGAFFGSVHQMLAGRQLAIPGHDAMAAVDDSAARKQIRAEAAAFHAYRERLAAAARRVEPAQAGQSATGAVTGGVEDRAGAGAPGDQLRLSRSGEAAGKAGAGAAGTTGGSDKAAAEGQVAREAALREQQERVAALEKNVADLQQLVELKNRQLAELQRQVEAARAPGVAGTVTAPAAGMPAAEPAAPAASSAESAAQAAAQPAAPSPAQPAATDAATSQSAPPATPATQAPAPATPQAGAAPAPAAEPGFIDDLVAHPLALPALGAIVLALGAYGIYSVRRRKKAEQVEEDGLVSADAFTANSLFGSTGGQAVDTSSSLFATGTRETGVDVHSTEVDPIAEAEVYIAYGREAQAEEILKEALKKQPERQAIRLKLLEIYAGRKDAATFAVLAQDMYDMAGGQNEEWPKVVMLGLSIDPANPLYTGDGESTLADGLGSPVAEARPDPFVEPSSAWVGAPAATTSSSAALSGAAGLAAAAADAADMLPADRMLPGDEAAGQRLGTPPASFAETVPMDDEAVAVPGIPALDFDLDLDTTIGRAASMREASGATDLSESELARAIDGRFELPSLEVDTAAASLGEDRRSDQEGMASVAAEPVALADLGDFKIDLPALEELDAGAMIDETATIGAAGDPGLAAAETEVAPAVDSSRWQEMATKLDLASAYEEIGDKEGARELLDEVLEGGDTAQQQKARSMLAKIG